MQIRLPNSSVHAHERGRGFPLVILHGGRLDHRHMVDALEPVFETLTGWRRLYVDLPGHGASTTDESVQTQDDVLDILLAFIDAVLPNQRYGVVGESRGSYLARGIVHRRRDDVDGMMLVGSGGFTDQASKRLPVHQTLIRADELRDTLPADQLARFDRLVVQNAEILEKIRRTKIPAAELADQALEQRILSSYEFSFDRELQERPFDKPCLILAGRQDAIAGYWDTIETLEAYPRATFAVLDRAGHSLSWEQPDLFRALTQEWLGRVNEERASARNFAD